jgi:hypothetical protein
VSDPEQSTSQRLKFAYFVESEFVVIWQFIEFGIGGFELAASDQVHLRLFEYREEAVRRSVKHCRTDLAALKRAAQDGDGASE